jgi:hypothetical protein
VRGTWGWLGGNSEILPRVVGISCGFSFRASFRHLVETGNACTLLVGGITLHSICILTPPSSSSTTDAGIVVDILGLT